MIKICFVTTVSITLKSFLLEFAKYLHLDGEYDVTFICDIDDKFKTILPEYVNYIPVSMKRGVSLLGIRSTFDLANIFRKEQFDIIQYSTPNAALYASIAAKNIKCKNRVYCQWGIRYMGFKGIKRMIFKTLEKIICKFSTVIEVESNGLLEYGKREGLYKKTDAYVVSNGSACGVNLEKYNINERNKWREQIRNKYNISDNTIVFGFAGRLTKDKGINELLACYKKISQYHNVSLFLVGSIDDEGLLDNSLLSWAQNENSVNFIEWTNSIEMYYSAFDIFVSPSYREGFGLVVIEAQAMGVPAIVTDVPGQIDSIVPNVTGLSVIVKSVESLSNAMTTLITNSEKRKEMSKNAVLFVSKKFEQQCLFQEISKKRKLMMQTQVFERIKSNGR